ncbi:MAG: zinc ribbon domain-containing protein [Candidatus Atabeyarchaeum deiterrae]
MIYLWNVVSDALSMGSGFSTNFVLTPWIILSYAAFAALSLASSGIALAAYICLIIGMANMRNRTGLQSFNTAMILFILFFIPFVFAFGLLTLGAALNELARKDEKKRCPNCGREIEPHELYCRFCGAELK